MAAVQVHCPAFQNSGEDVRPRTRGWDTLGTWVIQTIKANMETASGSIHAGGVSLRVWVCLAEAKKISNLDNEMGV